MKTKSTFLILSLVFLTTIGVSQENFTSAQLVSDSINKAHPFYDALIKKNKKYISWLYFHCNGLDNKNISKSLMNNPLIFSIKQEGITVQDTIANCIHPKLYENEREPEWQSEIPLYGSFPKYINFHLSNDPKTGVSIDVSINQQSFNFKIYVLTEEGDMVDTIIDEYLNPGDYELYWNTEDFKSGDYLIFTQIDEHLVIQEIEVEKHWFVNLFSRSKKTYLKKRIYTTVDDSPIKLKNESLITNYILHNRLGIFLAISLLNETQVKAKLFSIDGNYIATVIDEKLDRGESTFLLNDYVKETGWYLIQLTIDTKKQYIKVNIKR